MNLKAAFDKESTVNLHSLNFHWHFRVTFWFIFILKNSLCSRLISLPVMQTLFSLKPNMCLATNYCVIVPPKPSSIRDFPTELVSRYRQDYHHFKVGILESFVLSLFVLQSYQHEVINDINNSYPLQNKKNIWLFSE